MSAQHVIVVAFCALYGVIALATGGHAMFRGPIPGLDPMMDNTLRFLAGIWFGVGIGFFVVAWDPAPATQLFRLLMAALFIGGIGRLAGLVHFPPTPLLWFLIALELIPPTFLVPLQARLSAGSDPVVDPPG